MKAVINLVILLALCTTTSAFTPTRGLPSSFTGHITSVCTRGELRIGYSCAPNAFTKGRKGTNMAMQPFLEKLGLKKADNADVDSDGGNQSLSIIDNTEKEAKGAATISKETDVVVPEEEEELSETKKLLKQVKESGTAGIVSYALWELAFWTLSVPVCVFAYYELVGHLPDFTNKEDLSKLGGEAFAFVNFARFAVPLRIGLALSTTGWIQTNVVDKFFNKDEDDK